MHRRGVSGRIEGIGWLAVREKRRKQSV